jgi:uncharacterized protein
VERLDPVQIRVLGCLLEKQQTTPDAYPLTLNSLRTACNQATSRDPVVDYDEATVREAAQELGRRGLTRLASYHGSRAPKYRHLVDEALGISPPERALLCVLMLRGPQTIGELKQRSERLHPFADLSSVEQALDGLTQQGLGSWQQRRPGQKEARYVHLLEQDDRPAPGPEQPDMEAPPDERPDEPGQDLAQQLAALRGELEALRREVEALRERGI